MLIKRRWTKVQVKVVKEITGLGLMEKIIDGTFSEEENVLKLMQLKLNWSNSRIQISI